MEYSGILSVSAAPAAGTFKPWRGGSDRADVCSIPCALSGTRGAATLADIVADRRLGSAGGRDTGQRFSRQRIRHGRTLPDRRLYRGERCGDPARSIAQHMMDLLTSPEAWAALLTLTALEIVLGIDNIIFLSVIVSGIPPEQAKRARQIGLALALVFRILLLSLLVWMIGLTQDI